MNVPSQHMNAGKPHLRVRYPQLFDWVSMALYVVLVFGWVVNAYPMGRDYVEQDLPATIAPVWVGLQDIFGEAFWPYHAINILLVYGCMIAIFYLMKLTHQGPWWLGTLAAVLFMANPVHTESVANLRGMADLLPCFLALTALCAYCILARSGNLLWLLLALPLFAVAAFAAPEDLALLGVFGLFEAILASDKARKRLVRLLPMALVTAGVGWAHGDRLFAHGGNLAEMLGPLYFIFYPIGFLPSTVHHLHENPWLGWVGGAAVVAVLLLIYRKARRPVILFALLSIPVVRLFGGGRAIDPVHLVGGGQLLLASAFFAIALTGLFHRIMDHPKWRRIVINGTYLLCLLLMIIQVHALVQWRAAGNMLRDFHGQIRQVIEQKEVDKTDEALLIAPNIQYVNGAPLCMSESLVFGNRAVPFRPELPSFSGEIIATPYLNLFDRKGVRIQTTVEEGTVTAVVEGAKPVEIVPLDAMQALSVDMQADERFRLRAPFEKKADHLLVIPGKYPWGSSNS
ncbi:MAG: hypothetical protein R6V12_12800 [Candidatus Hydrogenedentota bacterium]